MNKINDGIYTSSNGKETPINELPYPYLVNAQAKAEREGDSETASILQEEINKRPKE